MTGDEIYILPAVSVQGTAEELIQIPWTTLLLALLAVSLLFGCGGMRVVGLHPEYPPLEKGTFSLFAEFVPVDSLQPVLRWQPFPDPQSPQPEQVTDVTYELRIWDGMSRAENKLKYTREELTAPEHRVEEPLDPSTRYLWSVRAKFLLAGIPRLTEWGMAGLTLRSETVPNPSCFRFETPPMIAPHDGAHQILR